MRWRGLPESIVFASPLVLMLLIGAPELVGIDGSHLDMDAAGGDLLG